MIYKQSGVVPYLFVKGKVHYVLVTNKNGRWIFPKGLLEGDLPAWESAAKEAYEEAGIVGQANDKIITQYTYNKWGGECRVDFYPMKVERLLETWEEAFFRKRCVLGFKEAKGIIRKELLGVLEAAHEKLSTG